MRIDQVKNLIPTEPGAPSEERFKEAVKNANDSFSLFSATSSFAAATGMAGTNGPLVDKKTLVAAEPTADNTDWIDKSKYSHAGDWDKITGNTSGTPSQQSLDLDRPAAAARMLEDNWQNWGMQGGIDFANPPTTLPPEALACLKYVSNSPTLMAALSSGGGVTRPDTTITRSDVRNFLMNSDQHLKWANNAYGKFLSNNPNATDLAKENAKSAAIVMANMSLVTSAGPASSIVHDDKKNVMAPFIKNDGTFNADNLKAIAGDPSLSTALTGAAGLWSNPGMLQLFDMGGESPLGNKNDGITMEHNIAGWLEKQAPKDDDGVLMMLSNAAIRGSVAGVDTSKLTKDVLDHPENYDAKTKAAVLMQLTDTRTQLALSKDSNGDLFSAGAAKSHGLNPNKAKVVAQVDDAIQKLGSDPDVQKYISDNQAAGMKAIVDSDPNLKTALQNYQKNKIDNGQILNDYLSQKGPDGNPLSMADALSLTANDATLTNLALGGDGKVDLSSIGDKAGKSTDIQNYFKDHILNGKDLQDALAADKQKNGDKSDPLPIIQKFAGDSGIFQAFLGDKISADDRMKVSTTINDTIADTILDGGNADNLKGFFADDNGNFDDAKVTAIIDKAKQADPTMFTDATGAPIATSDVVSMMRSTWDSIRQGNKIADVLPKVISGMSLNVSDAYKQGLLHIGSGLLAGGILVARSVQGGNTAVDNASKVAAGMQFFGTLVEGGAKYGKENGPYYRFQTLPMTDPVTHLPTTVSGQFPYKPDFDKLANAAKIVGGSGSFIGGVLGLYSGVNSALSGDPLNAGFSLTSGALGAIGGFASIVEGAAGLFGAATTAAWAGVVAGVAGWAGAIVGGIAGVVLPVIEVFKRQKSQDHFFGVIDPVLFQYGLTGGPEQPGDYPDDLYPIGV